MTYQVVTKPFDRFGNTVNLAVLATTANVQVIPIVAGSHTVRIANIGTNVVFVEFGTPNTTAATVTTSMPLLPNSVETFWFHNDWQYVAAIAASTGNTIYVTTGEGS